MFWAQGPQTKMLIVEATLVRGCAMLRWWQIDGFLAANGATARFYVAPVWRHEVFADASSIIS